MGSPYGFLSRNAALRIALLTQVVCGLLLLFGDVGFDKAGRYGLDVNVGVALGVLYLVGLSAGIAVTVLRRQHRWLGAQIMAPILMVSAVQVCRSRSYDPAGYQSLVGKKESDLRRLVEGRESISFDDANSVMIYNYPGMDVYIDRSNRTVLRVSAPTR